MGWVAFSLRVVTDSHGAPALMPSTLYLGQTMPHSSESGQQGSVFFPRIKELPGGPCLLAWNCPEPLALVLFPLLSCYYSFPTESSGVNVPCSKTLQWHDESGTPAGLWGEPVRMLPSSLSSGQQEPRPWAPFPLKPCARFLCLFLSPSTPLCPCASGSQV